MTRILNLVKSFESDENKRNERRKTILEDTKCPQEQRWVKKKLQETKITKSSTWPQEGHVNFSNRLFPQINEATPL